MSGTDPTPITGEPVDRPWGGDGVPSLGLAAPAGHTVGEWWLPTDEFPLLVKIIDARENLSVQLHPDDRVAAELNHDSGKTEAWYILDAAPDARILLGLKQGVETDDFFSAAEAGEDVSPMLESFAARPGDTIFVPPGTIHAIGAGVVLLEVQQRADVTFRVFDWNRVPARPLHLAESRRAVRSDSRAGLTTPISRPEEPPLRTDQLVTCDKFTMTRSRIDAGAAATVPLAPNHAEMWFCASGHAAMNGDETPLKRGGFVLWPNAAATARIEAAPGDPLTVIRMHLP